MLHAAVALAAALILSNAMVVAAFAEDKRRALAGEWRISEANLLWLAALGATPGAYWARRRFRHKTRKQPFGRRLDAILVVQAGVALGLAAAFVPFGG